MREAKKTEALCASRPLQSTKVCFERVSPKSFSPLRKSGIQVLVAEAVFLLQIALWAMLFLGDAICEAVKVGFARKELA